MLKDKAFKTANNLNYGGYQKELASMGYKFLDKKSKGRGVAVLKNKCQISLNLQINFINLLENQKKKSLFIIYRLSGALIYLICNLIYLFSKYTWVVPLIEKEVLIIVNAFQSILRHFKTQIK